MAAQAPQPPPAGQATDAVAALVTEVRALRTELAAMASASVRTQLLVARVQLQEQRLVHLDRQRAEISAKLRDAETMRAMFGGQLKQLTEPSAQMTPQQRKDAENALGPMKAQLEAMQASENSLKTEENNLLNAIATEQTRWTDFNSRLDQLEQSLPRTGR
jgi:chromosome segregation ATPase